MDITVPPYRWYPSGTQDKAPEVGNLVALWHRTWRVIEINDAPEVDWTDEDRAALEAIKPSYRHRRRPVHVILGAEPEPTDPVAARNQRVSISMGGARTYLLPTYPSEHWMACGRCGEPAPCREEMGKRLAQQAMTRMARYEMAGVCPACCEPVTARQKSLTWEDNVVVIGGPPVTYHAGRAGCRYSAADYEKAWVAADPERRRAVLSCTGHVTNHGPRLYSCTEGVECPGPSAQHRSYDTCRCPEHWLTERGHCTPDPRAERLPLGGGL